MCRLPEKLICKLEPDWAAEVAQNVKHHGDCTRMVRLDDFFTCSVSYELIYHYHALISWQAEIQRSCGM